MNLLGEKSFSGAAFANQQYSRIGKGRSLSTLQGLLHNPSMRLQKKAAFGGIAYNTCFSAFAVSLQGFMHYNSV
jgi:hypothetical protein